MHKLVNMILLLKLIKKKSYANKVKDENLCFFLSFITFLATRK